MTLNEYKEWIKSNNPKSIKKKSKVIVEVNS